ncbi:hypothetical protein F6455_13425 [Proteobacteria bacterium 005FR1]|nr:hypothetical protein [Proteobacteria bacterium 005FR1]
MSRVLTKSFITLSLLALAGWLLYPGGQASRNTRVAPWLQPESASSSFPLAMAPYLASQQVRRASSQETALEEWAFDFAGFERHFAEHVSAENNSILNDQLPRQFQSVFQNLPPSLDAKSVERISFLFRKSFPGTAGEQLSTVFGPIYYYHYEKEAAAKRIAQLHPPGSTEYTSALLDSAEAMQNEHFSREQVDQLFGKQNSLNRYLLQRRLVREDPELSAEQKRLTLRDLQSAFEIVK